MSADTRSRGSYNRHDPIFLNLPDADQARRKVLQLHPHSRYTAPPKGLIDYGTESEMKYFTNDLRNFRPALGHTAERSRPSV